MPIKTLQEAAEETGIKLGIDATYFLKGTVDLEMYFNPIVNWYAFTGVTCPRCENKIKWFYTGTHPSYQIGITNATLIV